MSELDVIKAPVKQELKQFDRFFKEATQSEIPLLNLVVNYMIRSKGKQIRPLFVFLSACMHGQINQNTYIAATSIELLHSATLIHDDVVDESYERRGLFSINALWRNKISVLVGDFLLAKGLLLTTREKAYHILDIISQSVKDMSEGELLQFEKSRKLNIDEATYTEIISKKTASLIATSMAAGTCSVTSNEETVQQMRKIGLLAGLAFQIRDDIFDYQGNSGIGKPTGNDIKEKKITLPLLYVINQADWLTRRKIFHIVKRKNNRKERVEEVIEMVNQKGGIEYATSKMNAYCNEAIELLMNFEPSEARDALVRLIEFTVNRKK
jgi:octaprenyl-diphosphate synthase